MRVASSRPKLAARDVTSSRDASRPTLTSSCDGRANFVRRGQTKLAAEPGRRIKTNNCRHQEHWRIASAQSLYRRSQTSTKTFCPSLLLVSKQRESESDRSWRCQMAKMTTQTLKGQLTRRCCCCRCCCRRRRRSRRRKFKLAAPAAMLLLGCCFGVAKSLRERIQHFCCSFFSRFECSHSNVLSLVHPRTLRLTTRQRSKVGESWFLATNEQDHLRAAPSPPQRAAALANFQRHSRNYWR